MRFLFVALVFATATYNYGLAVDIADIPELLEGNYAVFDEVLANDGVDFLPWRPRILTLAKCKKMIHVKCTKFSNLYTLLQCLWEKWYCEGVISNGVCFDGTKQYLDAQTIKRDCNKCACLVTSKSKIGSFVCTELVCNPTTTAPPITPVKVVTTPAKKPVKVVTTAPIKTPKKTPKVPVHVLTTRTPRPTKPKPTYGICKYEGKQLKHGETVKKDCNTCMCIAVNVKLGKLSCTRKICPTVPIKPKTKKPIIPTKPPTVKPTPPGVCYYNKKKYTQGTRIKVECNTCQCLVTKGKTVGLFACTKKKCPAPTPVKPIKPGNIGIPTEKPEHHGKACKEGKCVTVCADISKKLFCAAKGKVLKITMAVFGRTSTKTCRNTKMGPKSWHNTKCRSTTSMKKAATHCDGKRTCTLFASTKIFGDPCVGTNKYLHVAYKCVHPAKAPVTAKPQKHPVKPCSGNCKCKGGKCTVICEHNQKKISCPAKKVLKITSANYGRTSTKLCHNPKFGPKSWTNTKCRSGKHAFRKVAHRCNGKEHCTLVASNGVFGNPCVGTSKYLHVAYKCITPAAPVTTPIPHGQCYYILRRNCYTNRKASVFRCFWNKWFCKSGRLPPRYKKRVVETIPA